MVPGLIALPFVFDYKLQSIFPFRPFRSSYLDAEVSRHVITNPAFQALFEARWRPTRRSLDELSQLPTGTLGRAFADILQSQQLSPDSLYADVPIHTHHDYFWHRHRETHDIIHVLTGFPPTPIGEIGVQAFNLCQFRCKRSALYLFGGILKMLQEDAATQDQLFHTIARGLLLGLRAPCLLAVRLEDCWDVDLSTLRRRLQLDAAELG